MQFREKIRIILYQFLSYRHWEFWPASLFYIPVVFYYIFFMVKYRITATAISAVNPCFSLGGMAFDSKYDMISKFFHYRNYVAKTILVSESKNRVPESVFQLVKKSGFEYPFICKPDRGHRGNGVKIIRKLEDLIEYMLVCERSFLIQEYINYPLEYGIFWVKIPEEKKGRITSITRKILPSLKGDGKSTLGRLILSDKRAKYMAATYFQKNNKTINEVISKNEKVRICNTGNHCQGAIFEDGSEDIQAETFKKLEEICNSVKGYDFGRMDIKFENKEALWNGGDFKILEVNGSEAESTHIYDRKYSVLDAYKTLYKQWDTLFKIAKLNRTKGFFGLSTGKLIFAYIDFFKENREIKSD